MTGATIRPIDTVLARVKNAKPNGNGCTALCPAHPDTNRSLSIREGEDGRLLLKCFAGCEVEDITAALGLTVSDLYPSPRRNGHQADACPPVRAVVTLDALARDKGLPSAHLKALGLHNLLGGGVGVPYKDVDGSTLHTKRRTALRAKDGSFWPKGAPLVAYGLDRLGHAQEAGRLALVEGESDCWTLWHHDLPALGIPGATATKVLQPEYLEGIRTLYIVQEPDNSGAAFVSGVAKRLQEIGWQGSANVVRLEGAKDPNELHKLDPDGFPLAWQTATEEASPLTSEAEEPAAPSSVPATLEARSWPEELAPEAFHGLAGDVVRLIAPHTEASSAALLLNFLVAYGNANQ